MPDVGGNGIARTTHTKYQPLTFNGTITRDSRYVGWKPIRKFQHVVDGLSKTFLFGEKFVHPDHFGEWEWGDNSIYNDEHSATVMRVAGPGYPIAASPLEIEDDLFTTQLGSFGSWHAGGIANFVLADGSARTFSPTTNTRLLGYLGNIRDGQVISELLD